MAATTASAVRAAALRSGCLSLGSIGSMSGEYLGKKKQFGPRASVGAANGFAFMAAEIVLGVRTSFLDIRTLRTITESSSLVMRRVTRVAGCRWRELAEVCGDGRRERVSAQWEAVGSKLEERGRRLFAASEARSARWAGLAAVLMFTGLARSTINRGKHDLDGSAPPRGRIRRAGCGRRALSEDDPGFV